MSNNTYATILTNYKLNGIDLNITLLKLDSVKPIEGKAHTRAGFAKVSIKDTITLNFDVMLKVEDNTYWLAVPSVKKRGKWSPAFLISREHKQQLEMFITNRLKGSETTEEPVEDLSIFDDEMDL